MTTDNNGRLWAKVSEVKVGSKLELDGGFTCADEESVVEVFENDEGALCFPCDEEEHDLAGQLEKHPSGDYYIGCYLVSV